MPDSLELPGVLRAVVPLVCGEGFTRTRRRVVDELVALAGRHAAWRHGHPPPGVSPPLAAVARALDDPSEPPARLRRVKAIRIGGGSLQVIDLPPREVGAAHVPSPALPVRCQDERALTCANQYPYAAHASVLSEVVPRPGSTRTSNDGPGNRHPQAPMRQTPPAPSKGLPSCPSSATPFSFVREQHYTRAHTDEAKREIGRAHV